MYSPPVLTEYYRWPKSRLVARYVSVVQELAMTKTYIASHRADESRAHIAAFWQDTSASVAARERAADYQVSEVRATITEEQGTIDALTEERFLIEHLIEWGCYAIGEGDQPRDSVEQHPRDDARGISAEASRSGRALHPTSISTRR